VALRIVETSDPAETEALGAELAAILTDGDLVLVRGELGSGKTTLVRGAARALGVTGPVTSPTFSIGHRYRAANVTVSHLDLYRLAGLEHEDPALLADYLGPGRIAFVEWPQDGAGELSGARLRVTLSHRGADRRRIEVGSEPQPDASDEPQQDASDEPQRDSPGEPQADASGEPQSDAPGERR
jgi:tRNA threonylcarbamoyladenosine biosynthesis protein TsaE